MFRIPFAALVLCAALIAPAAQAQVSAGLRGLVRIEVLDGGATGRGTRMAALRLSMAQGWKTYWRLPGEAGIAPRFFWDGARNLGGADIKWPVPGLYELNGYQIIGYQDRLVLPIEITPQRPDRPVRLRGRMEIGLCKDVCIPGALSFDAALDDAAPPNPEIEAALADRPLSAAEAGMRDTTCRLSPIEGGLRLNATITMPTAGTPEVVVIEPGNPQVLSMSAGSRRSGAVLRAASDLYHVENTAFVLDRSQIRITVLGRNRAVDIRGCAPG